VVIQKVAQRLLAAAGQPQTVYGLVGRQLGFKRPQDWARLRTADVLRYRGKGLLKQFQFRIASLVREYLGY
jgi:hypothetical protein